MRWEGYDELSAQATERLSRPNASVPIALPNFADHRAVDEWRRATNELWGEDVRADEPPHTASSIGGVPVLVAGPGDGPVVVYVHGGGFCLGSPGVVVPITARLASHGLRVVSVGYRLAPEHPHPAAIDDVASVCAGFGDGPVTLAGDSAGGWIAAHAAATTAEGRNPAVGLALLSPLLGPPDAPNELIEAYSAPSLDLAESTIATLPPVLLQIGEREDPTPAERFERRCIGAGVDVDVSRWRHMWHTWHYHRALPEAAAALDQAAIWLRDRLLGPSATK